MSEYPYGTPEPERSDESTVDSHVEPQTEVRPEPYTPPVPGAHAAPEPPDFNGAQHGSHEKHNNHEGHAHTGLKAVLAGLLGGVIGAAALTGVLYATGVVGTPSGSVGGGSGTSQSITIDPSDEDTTIANAVAAKALPSVVTVYSTYADGEGMGSGVIYDKSGNFVRSVNIYSLFEMPVTAVTDVTYWTIEDYVYVQYTYSLPDDAKKYDCYVASEGKLGIVTMRYDIKKDKVKEFKNFDYVVSGASSTLTDLATGDEMRPTDYAVLSVSEINKDKQVSMPVVQTFKKNLGIYVNLQTLMPGATGISFYGGNVVLESYYTGETAVFDGKDEVASFIPAATPVNGGQAYRYGDSYYNFVGGHIYTLDSNEEERKMSANGVLWVDDDSSMTVKAINLANNSTTTYIEVDNISGSTDYLSVENGSAVDVIDMNTGNVIISGISDTASISIPTQSGDYRLIRVTENGINEFYRYGIVEKAA